MELYGNFVYRVGFIFIFKSVAEQLATNFMKINHVKGTLKWFKNGMFTESLWNIFICCLKCGY